MVAILVIFLGLVTGMCASIYFSCAGKIKERRQRELEYQERRSREASVEGQINQLHSASQDQPASRAAKAGQANSKGVAATGAGHQTQLHQGAQFSASQHHQKQAGRLIASSADSMEQHQNIHYNQQQQQLKFHGQQPEQPQHTSTYSSQMAPNYSNTSIQQRHHEIDSSAASLNQITAHNNRLNLTLNHLNHNANSHHLSAGQQEQAHHQAPFLNHMISDPIYNSRSILTSSLNTSLDLHNQNQNQQHQLHNINPNQQAPTFADQTRILSALQYNNNNNKTQSSSSNNKIYDINSSFGRHLSGAGAGPPPPPPASNQQRIIRQQPLHNNNNNDMLKSSPFSSNCAQSAAAASVANINNNKQQIMKQQLFQNSVGSAQNNTTDSANTAHSSQYGIIHSTPLTPHHHQQQQPNHNSNLIVNHATAANYQAFAHEQDLELELDDEEDEEQLDHELESHDQIQRHQAQYNNSRPVSLTKYNAFLMSQAAQKQQLALLHHETSCFPPAPTHSNTSTSNAASLRRGQKVYPSPQVGQLQQHAYLANQPQRPLEFQRHYLGSLSGNNLSSSLSWCQNNNSNEPAAALSSRETPLLAGLQQQQQQQHFRLQQQHQYNPQQQFNQQQQLLYELRSATLGGQRALNLLGAGPSFGGGAGPTQAAAAPLACSMPRSTSAHQLSQAMLLRQAAAGHSFATPIHQHQQSKANTNKQQHQLAMLKSINTPAANHKQHLVGAAPCFPAPDQLQMQQQQQQARAYQQQQQQNMGSSHHSLVAVGWANSDSDSPLLPPPPLPPAQLLAAAAAAADSRRAAFKSAGGELTGDTQSELPDDNENSDSMNQLDDDDDNDNNNANNHAPFPLHSQQSNADSSNQLNNSGDNNHGIDDDNSTKFVGGQRRCPPNQTDHSSRGAAQFELGGSGLSGSESSEPTVGMLVNQAGAIPSLSRLTQSLSITPKAANPIGPRSVQQHQNQQPQLIRAVLHNNPIGLNGNDGSCLQQAKLVILPVGNQTITTRTKQQQQQTAQSTSQNQQQHNHNSKSQSQRQLINNNQTTAQSKCFNSNENPTGQQLEAATGPSVELLTQQQQQRSTERQPLRDHSNSSFQQNSRPKFRHQSYEMTEDDDDAGDLDDDDDDDDDDRDERDQETTENEESPGCVGLDQNRDLSTGKEQELGCASCSEPNNNNNKSKLESQMSMRKGTTTTISNPNANTNRQQQQTRKF